MRKQPVMSADDKKWQAESDARCLADAEAIKKDQKRMCAASEAAKRMADEAMAKGQAMKKIASGHPKPKGKKKK